MKKPFSRLSISLLACLFFLSACSPGVSSPAPDLPAASSEPTPTTVEDYVLIVGDTPAPETATASSSEEVELVDALGMQMDSETIRLRLLRNYTRWDTLWVDGLVKYYAAEGSDTPVQTIRTQVWVDQGTGRFRVLNGSQPDTVEHLVLSDGMNILDLDLISQASQVYSVAPLSKEAYTAPETVTDTITPHPLEGMLGTPLGSMIFSSGIAQRGGIYQPQRMETFAGRETLVVDWYRAQGMLVDRFWIDSETGIILRWQNLGKGGGESVQTEMILNRIEFGADMPAELFNPEEIGTPAFIE